MIKIIIFILFFLLKFNFNFAQTKIQGTVFEDINKNGILDNQEKGISGVPVSNQETVVITDKDGKYSIEIPNPGIIFVTKPAGYSNPLNENNLPKFHYIYSPQGSPVGMGQYAIKATGPLPKELNFPLYKTFENDTFTILAAGDPQPDTITEVDYYRDDIITDMLQYKADFYIAMGDLVNEKPELYDPLNESVRQLGMPVYNVMGNHDMNMKAINKDFEAETFKSFYGPEYYSFDYGKVHFIILNSVEYSGWNARQNKRGTYIGGFGEKQLKWLENDLTYVKDDKLVVFASHIPFRKEHMKEEEIRAFFKIIKNRKNLLTLFGHMHTIENYEYDESLLWQEKSNFNSLTLGAGCGSWWSKPLDERGIPVAIGMDGSPNGYFIFNFKGDNYAYLYKPANFPENFQLRISSPESTISADSLKTTTIIVNVFAGNKKSMVEYQIDNQLFNALNFEVGIDPFAASLLKRYPEYFKRWVSTEQSYHLWKGQFPSDLKPGIHKLTARVKDEFGKTFYAYKLIEVK